MPEVIDQMGRRVEVPGMPQRIVSLVPSQTELLYDLGLGDRVVGITKFCIYPESWRKSKAIVGGTKQYRFETIRKLNPDLIIGNKEENEQQGIETLAQEFPVWMSDIFTLSDAIDMINKLGALVGKKLNANLLSEEILGAFSQYKKPKEPKSALYLIWKKPYMATGQQTFINEMLKVAGYRNIIDSGRYPELTIDEIEKLSPEVILLSSEPYPFKEKDLNELEEIFPDTTIRLVDGEIFSWYGSRLLKAPEYFSTLR